MTEDSPKGISELRLRCLKCGQKGVAHFEQHKRKQTLTAVPVFASDGFYLRMRKKRETHLQIVCERCGMTQRASPP